MILNIEDAGYLGAGRRDEVERSRLVAAVERVPVG
jgi:hypothetical protein